MFENLITPGSSCGSEAANLYPADHDGPGVLFSGGRSMKYSDKLKDPRWQEKRLAILHRDDHTCQYCGLTESALHVHHVVYQKDKEPWDSPSCELITLCEACHEVEHEIRVKAEKAIVDILRRYRFSAIDIARLGDIITSRIKFKPCAGTEFILSLE